MLLVYFAVPITSITSIHWLKLLARYRLYLLWASKSLYMFMKTLDAVVICVFWCTTESASPYGASEWLSEAYSLCQVRVFYLLSLIVTDRKGNLFIYTWTQNQVLCSYKLADIKPSTMTRMLCIAWFLGKHYRPHAVQFLVSRWAQVLCSGVLISS
jgi:hypothetical protein